jgi:hypothetical protein
VPRWWRQPAPRHRHRAGSRRSAHRGCASGVGVRDHDHRGPQLLQEPGGVLTQLDAGVGGRHRARRGDEQIGRRGAAATGSGEQACSELVRRLVHGGSPLCSVGVLRGARSGHLRQGRRRGTPPPPGRPHAHCTARRCRPNGRPGAPRVSACRAADRRHGPW